MDVESSKDLLNQVEKIQGDLQKVASFQQKVLHRKVGNREKYGSLKRLSSERASAVSCILSALLNSLPISYCDEARFSFFFFCFFFILSFFLTFHFTFQIKKLQKIARKNSERNRM